VVVLGAVAMWALAVYRRLVGLREQVKLAWKRLEAEQANEAVKTVYNKHVTLYNAALDAFPAYLIAPLTGLKPARHFN
jgi:hypothetical protein